MNLCQRFNSAFPAIWYVGFINPAFDYKAMSDKRFLAFALVSWFILMVFAIVNAGIREGFYVNFLNELQAHQMSTFTLMVIIVLYTYVLLRFSGYDITERQAVTMGGIWFIMTVAFEFLAGHYVFGSSWDELWGSYNILNGRVWALIPISVLLAPLIIKRIISEA